MRLHPTRPSHYRASAGTSAQLQRPFIDRLSLKVQFDSLFVGVKVVFLESRWNTLHDFLGLLLVVNLVSEQVAGSSQLQLGDAVLFALLDCDLFCGREELLLS